MVKRKPARKTPQPSQKSKRLSMGPFLVIGVMGIMVLASFAILTSPFSGLYDEEEEEPTFEFESILMIPTYQAISEFPANVSIALTLRNVGEETLDTGDSLEIELILLDELGRILFEERIPWKNESVDGGNRTSYLIPLTVSEESQTLRLRVTYQKKDLFERSFSVDEL